MPLFQLICSGNIRFIFIPGVKYQIDKYIGTCEPVLVVIGDFFVKYQSNSPDIALMSAAEFFHLKDAQTQYVGKVNF